MSNKSNTLEYFENKISNLNNIDKWENKLIEIQQIKDEITSENNNINNLLLLLDKETLNNKEYDIDSIIENFNKFDTSKKIKYYQYLNQYIKTKENELFNT
jgi:hypothetical protein